MHLAERGLARGGKSKEGFPIKRPADRNNQKKSDFQNVSVETNMTKLNYETLKPLRPLKIQIVEIESAQLFWAQEEDFLNKFEELCMECNKASALQDAKSSHFDVNQMCLVQSPSIKQWYRGRVKSIRDEIYEIFLVDTATVVRVKSTHGIRLISERLSFTPPHGAKQCCLYNSAFLDNAPDANPKEAMIYMLSMPHTMIVIEVIDNLKMVDIIIDEKFSMRDALQSLHMIRPDLTVNLKDKRRSEDLEALNMKIAMVYKNSNTVVPENYLMAGDSRRVRISYRISPFEIYVLDEDEYDMNQMQIELNRQYKNVCRQRCFLIKMGMYCVCFKDDSFHRVKIIQGCNNNRMVEVFFLEIGTTILVPWHTLYVLDEAFFMLPQCAIRCSLTHIQPLTENNYIWTEKDLNKFNNFVNTRRPIIIKVVRTDHAQKVKICYIKMSILRNEKMININGFLVHELKIAESIGTASDRIEEEEQKDHQAESYSDNTPPVQPIVNHQRVNARVVNCITPGEFYLTLADNLNGIEQLNAMINQHVKDTLESKWKIGDLCLVQSKWIRNSFATPTVSDKNWYRGQIIELNADQSQANCFLTDFGHNVKVDLTDILEMPAKFDKLVEGATKCHLSSCVPTAGSNNYSLSSIDEFNSFIAKFGSEMAVTQYGNKNDQGSTPVILWGIENEVATAFAPPRIKYHSVIRYLCDKGYIYTREKFLNSHDFDPQQWLCGKMRFDDWFKNINDHIDKATVTSIITAADKNVEIIQDGKYLSFNNFIVKTEKSRLDMWKNAIIIDKSLFEGKPTHVDDHCTIYLHSSEQDELLKNMTEVLNRFYQQRPQTVKYTFEKLSNNMPCIARFYVDNLFHRGQVVRQVSPNNYDVRFVDYGNVETVPAIDLFADVLLAEIPIQALKYSLDGLVPNSLDGKWPLSTRDFVHANVVDKFCQIRVKNDYLNEKSSDVVKPCSLIIVDLNVELNKYMIKEEMAKYDDNNHFDRYLKIYDTHQRPHTMADKCGSSQKEQIFLRMEREVEQRDRDENYDEIFSSLLREREIEADEEETKKLLRAADIDDVEETVDDCQLIEPHITFIELSDDSDIEMVPTADSIFLSIDSSETLNCQNSIFKLMCDDLKVLDIQKMKLNEFRFDVIGHDDKHLFVRPITPMHLQDMNELKKVLAHLTAFSDRLRKMRKFREGQLCLAKWSKDSKWYRAKIVNYDMITNNVKIQFVDYLNFETVDESNVREFPFVCFSYPLSHTPVSPISSHSAKNYLNEQEFFQAITGHQLLARVQSFSDDGIPAISIHDNNTETILY